MEQTPLQPFVKGYKFQIHPTQQQIELFTNTFGCCRYIYNHLLAESKAEYQAYVELREHPTVKPIRPNVSGFGLSQKLTTLKKDSAHTFLNNVSSVALQQTVLHLGTAFDTFFRTKKGYPGFKKKYSKQSFNLTKSGFRFIDGNLYIAKSKEPLAINYSRELPSDPDSLTISMTPSGNYYISFTCQYTPPKTSGQGVIGIDVGIKHLATLSDGTKVPNLHHYGHKQPKLRRLQQALSRKQKGSANRTKAKIQLASRHESISNSRSDQLHKLSRQLVNENQVIGIESLVVRNMIRNRKLSKSIQDVSWTLLRNMLIYKVVESQHCNLVLAHQYYPSSHLCNVTGNHLGRKLQLQERSWQCPHCGQTHDRDTNAALNLAKEANRALHMSPQMPAGKIIFSDTEWATLQ